MGDKQEFYEAASTDGGFTELECDTDEKASESADSLEWDDNDRSNSRIEAVRYVVPVTDDHTLPVLTFRFWILSFLFGSSSSVMLQYFFFRTTTGPFSMFFVNLVSYSMGKSLSRILPVRSIKVFGYSVSLNPGPFNIKEHALIGIAVSTAACSAYAIDILSATDLFLHHRMSALGSLILIISTQCIGYGMAGMLRRYLVYPAEMVWWPTLCQIVFYNAIHNTNEFKTRRMICGWSYMKFFWIFCGAMFLYEFIPQWLAPMLLYFDWLCWINPLNKDFWALFSSIKGAGIMSLSFDWTSIGGPTMWIPLSTQLCSALGVVLSYWIILPILWLNNILGTKDIGTPLTPDLFYANGSAFQVTNYLNPDFTLNVAQYESGPPARMSPMYALGFLYSFVGLTACLSHVVCFHGTDILKSWRSAVGDDDMDVHTRMMKVYPEVPQSWYAICYILMMGLSMVACEVYDLQLPWWGLLTALALGWVLTLPVSVMVATTATGPGLNVITELACGYLLPGKAIANMTFKCYGYMAMYQCLSLLGDLKLGHYMKIPPRAMFVTQFWGTFIGGVFQYLTMTAIINTHRAHLDHTLADPTGMWTSNHPEVFWGSALIYGALGPRRTLAIDGEYGFLFLGFLFGAFFPILLWILSKKYPKIQWSEINITIIAGGMNAFPNGYTGGVLPSLVVCLIFQYYIFRYHKNWWKKYVFILSAALDTGAALTGMVLFLFLNGGANKDLIVNTPSWWGNFYNTTDPALPNWPYKGVDKCGAATDDLWTGGK